MDNGPNSDQFKELLEFLPVSEESTCSYYADRKSRYRAFRFDGTLAEEAHEVVLNRGYRRCGSIYYAAACRNCQACIPYRLDIAGFEPSKSQRRVLKRNRDVVFNVGRPVYTEEKETLYLRYSRHQHPYDPIHEQQIRNEVELLETLEIQMYSNPESTREWTMQVDDKLAGFGIFDVAEETLSAVYNVYDPDHYRRSLGTLAILLTMDWGAANGYRFLNLGYFIAGHPKMDYKRRFGPAETLDWKDGDWHPFSQRTET
jgi:arginine-tRNA-protein transferase